MTAPGGPTPGGLTPGGTTLDTPAVRRLGPGDVAVMRSLNALFGEVFDDAATYTGAPPDDACLERLLAMPGNVVIVAMLGEHVIGGLVAYRLEKFEQQRSELHIYDLAAPDRRRQGVASALIAAV